MEAPKALTGVRSGEEWGPSRSGAWEGALPHPQKIFAFSL